MKMKNVKSEAMNIRDTGHKEKWLQNYIADNSSSLGLGELSFMGKERRQPDASRLDLLFEDESKANRYAVEVQLNSPDPGHIIRAIGYWDSERRRFPEYNYCAVLVAENVLSGRYSNVVSLLSEKFPLIVIQVTALRLESRDEFALAFTTVLEDAGKNFRDKNSVQADRDYWARGSTAETIKWVDGIFEIIREFAPNAQHNYCMGYIGVELDGESMNFTSFTLTQNSVTAHVAIPKKEEIEDWDQRISEAGVDIKPYDKRGKNYQLVLKNREEISSKREFLCEIMKYAYDYRMGNV